MNYLKEYKNIVFEDVKYMDEEGNEYWYARELQIVLGYRQWRSIKELIDRAMIACKESSYDINDHFAVERKMIKIAKGAERKIIDYRLSRYACYLIVMNGNPKKEIIALAQTYFAIQTRKQELSEEEYDSLSEDEKRIYQRNKVRSGNIKLNKTALNAGVKNFGEFHNSGYRGLYNGETADDIFKRKNLNYRQDILDFMGSDELIYNLFRISLTDQSIKSNHIYGEKEACNTHFETSKDIREFIKIHGGTMPENLPTPNKSIDEIKIDKYIGE